MTSLDFSLDHVLAGRYRVHGLLGHGGMSDVYRADDLRTGEKVALKVVRSGDPSFARRLVQEARALERLEHPGLVRLLDAGAIDDRAYLAMELVEGPTLAEVLRHGPLGPARTARLGRSIAGALGSVHRAGVVHRDVKPGNVLIDTDGTARLGDFGIALLVDSSTLTAEGTTLGTAAYMAPEQLEDHQVGPQADTWSLGMVLLECLTGRRVYQGGAEEVIARRLTGTVPLPAGLTNPWRRLLTGMLDHRPERRLRDDEVVGLLADTVFDSPWPPVSAAAPQRTTATLQGRPSALSDTDVAPAARHLVRTGARRRRRRRSLLVVSEIVAATLALALAFALAVHFTAAPERHRAATSPPAHTGTKVAGTPPTSTTTSTTSTTTTATAPAPAGSTALATLQSDVQNALGTGTIDQDGANAVIADGQAAVSDAAAGGSAEAASDLQQAASVIAAGVDDGSVTQPTASELDGDLAALASALGVAAPSAPSPAAPAPTSGTGPAQGPGPAQNGGPRHGHGNGPGDES